ncbi:MAG: hypothetical protein QXH24_01960 [Candidatus Bathyarchaeia archaeon]
MVLTEDEIKLRYTGFIVFLSRLISIGTGLIFTLLVTRNISPKDYGVYGNLGDILSYFTLISTIIPFWITRFRARRWPGSLKTGLFMNTLIGLASITLYLLSIVGIMHTLQVGLNYIPVYMVSAAMILENHILAVFEAALYPKRPEKIGFGLLVFEVNKVILGLLFLYVLGMGLLGALISLIIAYFCQAIFYVRLLWREFRERIVWAYIKEWLKASTLNVYGVLGERLLVLANIFLFIYGEEISRAYYGASYTIASLVTYSSSLAFALYPKLLAGTRSEDITVSMKMVLMFALPMFLGIIVLSSDLLSILNPVYSVASPILIILALSSLIVSVSSIFESIIIGTEDFDAAARISFKRAFKSKIFLLLTLRYIQAAIVLPSTYLVLSLFPLDVVSSTLYFALIGYAGNIIITFAKLLKK